MSWRDWIPKKKRAAPIADVPTATSSRNFGPGVNFQQAHDVLLRENRSIANAATRAIENRIASLELQVVTDTVIRPGTVETEIVDGHPLQEAFLRPHPDFSMQDILGLLANWIVTVGEGYLNKIRNGFDKPMQLQPVIPNLVEPKVVSGRISDYLITDADGKQYSVPAREMVRVWRPDPKNPWRSEGYLGPSANTLDAHRFATEHMRAFFQFDATPKVVLYGEADAQQPPKPGTPDGDRYWARWAQDYQRRYAGESQGIPRPIAPGWKVHELEGGINESTIAILEYWRDELLMTMGGVPRSVLGQVVSGDRSSAEVNQWVFDMYAVAPIAARIENAFTLQLASEFESNVRVRFAPFISTDKEYEVLREKQDLEHAVRTINDVRKDRGEDPVEWGDEPTMLSTVKKYDPNAPEPAPVQSTPPQPPRTEREAHIAVRREFRKKGAA